MCEKGASKKLQEALVKRHQFDYRYNPTFGTFGDIKYYTDLLIKLGTFGSGGKSRIANDYICLFLTK